MYISSARQSRVPATVLLLNGSLKAGGRLKTGGVWAGAAPPALQADGFERMDPICFYVGSHFIQNPPSQSLPKKIKMVQNL